MPLFEGEQIVDVTTPDGRTAKLPLSVARSLQALTLQPMTPMPPPAPEPVLPQATIGSGPPPAGELPAYSPQDLAPFEAPLIEDPRSPEGFQNRPDERVAIVAPGDTLRQGVKRDQKADAATNKAAAEQTRKQERLAQAYAATPAGQRMGAAENVVDAIDEQRRALFTDADVRGAGLARTAHVQERANAAIAEKEAAAAADVKEAAEAEAGKVARVTALGKKIENYRIDRKIDHPILAAISLALAGLGSAMKKEGKNPALDILWETLDRKVAAQMQDLDQMKSVYGMAKEEVADLRASLSSKISRHGYLIGLEANRAAREIEIIGTQTQSETVRTNAQMLAAQLRERGAVAVQGAIENQLTADQRERFHKDTIGLGQANLAENQRQHGLDLKYKYDALAVQQEAALSAAYAKGREAEVKRLLDLKDRNEERGVTLIPRGEDGKPVHLMTAEGRAALETAAKLREQAKALRDKNSVSRTLTGGLVTADQDAKAAQLEQQADVVEGTANIEHRVRFADVGQKREFQKKYTAAQDIVNEVGDIFALYDRKDGGKAYWETTPGQAAIEAKLQIIGAKVKDAWQMGALDKGLVNYLAKTGLDEKQVLDGLNSGNIMHLLGAKLGRDPEAWKEKLNALNGHLEKSLKNDLSTTDWDGKGELLIKATDPAKDPLIQARREVLAEETPEAIANKLEGQSTSERFVGGFRPKHIVGLIKHGLTGEGNYWEKQAEGVRGQSSLKYSGLSEKQAGHFDLTLKAAQSGKEKEKALNSLVLWATTGSQELNQATMVNLRDKAPAIYEQVKKRLPDGPLLDMLNESDNMRAKTKSGR